MVISKSRRDVHFLAKARVPCQAANGCLVARTRWGQHGTVRMRRRIRPWLTHTLSANGVQVGVSTVQTSPPIAPPSEARAAGIPIALTRRLRLDFPKSGGSKGWS